MASIFPVKCVDLRIVKSQDIETPEKDRLQVMHRFCGTKLIYQLDEQDPVNSSYCCDNYFCRTTWLERDIAKLDNTVLNQFLYTVLVEDEDDLKDWPIKLTTGTDGKRLFGKTRSCTSTEILESRIRRIIEIREAA